ncbi:N-acetylmannosaminyltransferase [Thermanaeromonas toyohensis ToBE]|uniref:N-acetylglucosaminyldiphosphoundecaprenol N-acetyl-beta-D-mannosaminyltransferase n=1 Tax=Thermanaeromonas toyohensis ToBE TaxID=698762 RepID=A0A1W1V8D5_9FIRM|nr:WecB/TagA/CpsF family glycosyltransferase [Thermanaeromonas toyohensis]SMB89575.1 N-acetylmannosaminyltransferase [Thermanaeromonas toyohensis ToBE]
MLGCRVDGFTLKEAVELLSCFIASGKPHHVVTLNAEMAYRALHDPELKDIINRADLVTPDGAGVVWATRILGTPVPERVAGIDLVQALAWQAAEKGWRLFLYGGVPGVAEEAARKLKERHPGLNIIGTSHGYLSKEEERELLQHLKENRPHLLLVALGSPKQEYWIAQHLKELGVPVAIGVGGSLDVLAGRIRRAPRFMQGLGLEWLYRVLQEPKRVKRVLALPKFIIAVLTQARKLKRTKRLK